MERKTKPPNNSTRLAPKLTLQKSLGDLISSDTSSQDDAQRFERVLTERALQLAKVDNQGQAQGEQITVVLIRLGRELLGLDVQYVFDIRTREAITRVPRVPDWVVGVTNLRGNILSVIDLRKYFGLPSDPTSGDGENPGLLVIVQTGAKDQNGAMEIVFLVDDVLGVETLPARNGAVDGGMIHSMRPEYIEFIGEREASAEARDSDMLAQRHVVILNVEGLLADQRLIIHEEIS